MGPKGEDRKNLAVIMLEYPPESRRMEQTSLYADQKEQSRKYTRAKYRRTFTTPIGKRNHVAKNRECKQDRRERDLREQMRRLRRKIPSTRRYGATQRVYMRRPSINTADAGNAGQGNGEAHEIQGKDEYTTQDIAKWEIVPWTPKEQTGGNKQKGSYHHIQGRPKQPQESMGNSKGALRYSAETENGNVPNAASNFPNKQQEGEAVHAASLARKSKKKRLKREQYALANSQKRTRTPQDCKSTNIITV